MSLGTWSSQLPTRFLVSGGTHATISESCGFAYRALTVCGGPSQGPSAPHGFAHSVRSRSRPIDGRPTPRCHRPTDHSDTTVWASPRSLAATRGISADFLAEDTEMFPFSSRPSRRIVRVTSRGFPIRTARDHWMLGSSPARFGAVLRPSSASHRQGIHRLLCVSLRTSAPSLLRPLLACLCRLHLVRCVPADGAVARVVRPGLRQATQAFLPKRARWR